MKPDPFYIKRYPKWHPKRLFPTLSGRLDNRIATVRFAQYALPLKIIDSLPPLPYEIDWTNTALQQTDMQYILWAWLQCTLNGIPGACVEVGSFRGVTTRFLAQAIYPRILFAIDPHQGYGGENYDYELFVHNTQDMENVQHLGMTSGDAFRSWKNGPVVFAFIDAVHDFPNTHFDIEAWGSLMSPNGIIAAHDTDNPMFAGTRRAVYEAAQCGYELVAHPSNLTLLRKRQLP